LDALSSAGSYSHSFFFVLGAGFFLRGAGSPFSHALYSSKSTLVVFEAAVGIDAAMGTAVGIDAAMGTLSTSIMASLLLSSAS
jgi:hypothetical protein